MGKKSKIINRRNVFAALLILIVSAELILAFKGPLAFRKKTSIMVSRPYTDTLSEEEALQMRTHIEKELAKSGEFRIYTHELIINYFTEQEDRPDFRFEDALSYRKYIDTASSLGIEQVCIITAFSSDNLLRITLTMRNVKDYKAIQTLTFYSRSNEDFLEGRAARPINEQGKTSFKLHNELDNRIGGIEAFDLIYFFILTGQFVLSILIIMKLPSDFLNQFLLFAGLLIYLFSYVYAQNAGLEYVQRFIASGGQINLAPDTRTEQLHAGLRFLPMLLLNLTLYCHHSLRRMKEDNKKNSYIERIATHWGLALSAASAFIFTISFPSFISLDGISILAWVCLIPLFLALINNSAHTGILYIICFGALSTLLLNYWHGTFSYVSLAFTVALSTVQWIVFSIIFVPSVKSFGKWGFAAAALLWVIFEYCRTIGYIGYPWGLIGVSQYSAAAVIQIADITGVLGISLIVLIVNTSAAWTIAGIHRDWKWFTLNKLPLWGAAGLLMIILVYGSLRIYIADQEAPADTMEIALLQPNTDPRKHDYRKSFEILVQLTEEAIEESGAGYPDLIVWPEGGFKPDIRYYRERENITIGNAALVKDFDTFLSEHRFWLLTGSQDHMYEHQGDEEKRKRRNFNSSYLFRPGGEIEGIYHKMHLVPFTEHFPYKEELPWLAELLDKFNTSNWKQGEKRHIFSHPKADFLTPICFEDIFPDDIRKFAAQGAQLIVNISNDYWSLTPVEGKQHAAHALFRSVENRIPTVRSTASGRTGYIDRTGRLLEEHPGYYTEGYLLLEVPVYEKSITFYQRWGEWIIWISVLLYSVLQFLFLLRRRRVSN